MPEVSALLLFAFFNKTLVYNGCAYVVLLLILPFFKSLKRPILYSPFTTTTNQPMLYLPATTEYRPRFDPDSQP